VIVDGGANAFEQTVSERCLKDGMEPVKVATCLSLIMTPKKH
jgi:hypothetical protein